MGFYNIQEAIIGAFKISFLLSRLRLTRDKVLSLLLKVRPPTINFNIWGRGEGAVEGKGAVFHRLWQSSLHGTITSEGVHGIRPKVMSNAPFDLQADMGQIERSI